jgi:hypothetical protein
MYVVGANLLSLFWCEHPAAEGELRAFHALLSESEPGSLAGRLGAIAEWNGSGARIALAAAEVRLEINAAAGVARIAAITEREEEG